MAFKKRSLRERALGYLARREYSRAELFRKLLPYAKEAYVSQSIVDAAPSSEPIPVGSENMPDISSPPIETHSAFLSAETIEHRLSKLLDELEYKGFLSDQRFTQSLLHRRASRLGNSRILSELKQHQLDPSLIEQANEHLRMDESARLYAVWHKKYGQPPATFPERIKQARFLASRGFSHGAITALLGSLEQE